jgi:hypothetical protein
MWMGDPTDETGVVDISPVPGLLDPVAMGYLHYVSWQLRGALARSMAHAMPHLDFTAGEREWLDAMTSDDPVAGSRPFCRLDVLIGTAAPGELPDVQLIEVNTVGVGGLNYVRDASEIWLDTLAGRILEEGEALLLPVPDPREVLWEEFLSCFDEPVGSVAVVDLGETWETDGELRRLVDWIGQRGVDALFVEPDEIEVMRGNHIVARDEPVDAVLRLVDLADLSAMELEAGRRLRGIRAAMSAGCVWPPLSWEGDHKTVLEWMQTPECLSLMTASQREVVLRHVLWTRSLADRETTGPAGRPIDLLRYVRHQRRMLVLKPNRGYGGEGVLIGAEVSQQAWDRAIDVARDNPTTMVVQRCGLARSVDVPVSEDGTVDMAGRYTVAGLFPGRQGVGVLGRIAQERVVNITRGAAVMPYVVDMS